MIAEGHADFMVVEAADTPDHAFTAQPVKEAAGALLLESRAAAEQRGAAILAVVEPDAASGAAASDRCWPGAPVAGSLLDVVAWLQQTREGAGDAPLDLPGLRLHTAAAVRGGRP